MVNQHHDAIKPALLELDNKIHSTDKFDNRLGQMPTVPNLNQSEFYRGPPEKSAGDVTQGSIYVNQKQQWNKDLSDNSILYERHSVMSMPPTSVQNSVTRHKKNGKDLFSTVPCKTPTILATGAANSPLKKLFGYSIATDDKLTKRTLNRSLTGGVYDQYDSMKRGKHTTGPLSLDPGSVHSKSRSPSKNSSVDGGVNPAAFNVGLAEYKDQFFNINVNFPSREGQRDSHNNTVQPRPLLQQNHQMHSLSLQKGKTGVGTTHKSHKDSFEFEYSSWLSHVQGGDGKKNDKNMKPLDMTEPSYYNYTVVNKDKSNVD